MNMQTYDAVVSKEALLNKRLADLLSEERVPHRQLREAAHYALFPGGKRLRPQILLSIAGEKALDIACAIEFIHTYSLIHDDLPSMDDDDYRRGKPSLHKAFDEATAILTGDFFLTYAFEVVAKAPFPSPLIVRMLQLFTEAIGAHGMLGGQILDITHKEALTWEAYQELSDLKTTRLFSLPLEIGALLKNAPSEELNQLKAFGKTFGLLYQLQDDLADGDSPFTESTPSHQKELIRLLQKRCRDLASKLANPFLLSLIEAAL